MEFSAFTRQVLAKQGQIGKMKVLSALFVTLLLSLSAMGQDDPKGIIDPVRIESVPASPGDRIDAPICLVDDEALRGLTVPIKFEQHLLTLDTGDVSLKIFNIRGRLLRTLVDKRTPAGYREMTRDGRDQSDRAAASGVHLYQLRTRDFSKTRSDDVDKVALIYSKSILINM